MSSDLLPEAVWRQLNPRAARLGRGSRRLLITTLVVTVTVCVSAVLGTMSGLLNSQLAAEGGGGGAEANSHVVQLTERLNNGGWFDEHIDAVDVTAPQFRLIRASGAGQTISPGRTGSVTVVVRVLDCAPVTRTTGIPVQIRLHRFWGEKTLTAGTFESSSLPWDACHPA